MSQSGGFRGPKVKLCLMGYKLIIVFFYRNQHLSIICRKFLTTMFRSDSLPNPTLLFVSFLTNKYFFFNLIKFRTRKTKEQSIRFNAFNCSKSSRSASKTAHYCQQSPIAPCTTSNDWETGSLSNFLPSHPDQTPATTTRTPWGLFGSSGKVKITRTKGWNAGHNVHESWFKQN